MSQEPAAITELNYERILSVRLNYEYYIVNYYFMYCHVCLFLRNGNRFFFPEPYPHKNMADKGNKRAALVLKLSSDYDRLLSTILIGNNIVNIASASLSTLLFVRFLGEDMGASVSTAVTTVVVLIFGEVSPKSIAKEAPESFAMFSAPLLNGFALLLTPLNFLFKQWKKCSPGFLAPPQTRLSRRRS